MILSHSKLIVCDKEVGEDGTFTTGSIFDDKDLPRERGDPSKIEVSVLSISLPPERKDKNITVSIVLDGNLMRQMNIEVGSEWPRIDAYMFDVSGTAWKGDPGTKIIVTDEFGKGIPGVKWRIYIEVMYPPPPPSTCILL